MSTVDIIRAYFNTSVLRKRRSKTAVVSPAGFLFEYTQMSFGLRNAPATFQRFINNILRDTKNVFIYMDDILIFTNSLEECYIVLRKIF